MLASFFEEMTGKGITALLGLVIGGAVTLLYSRWKRLRERHSILQGDARDTIVIQQHLLATEETLAGPGEKATRRPKVLRIRSLGQAELDRVVPNGHLAAVLLKRAFEVTPLDTLISMEGAEGSYLLETLTNFVCDRVAHAPFEHDLFVMAPCCEPVELAEHQPITILLVAVKDLALFENWPACRNILVEHGSDGARVLTLLEMAQRFRFEQDKIQQLRMKGQRTKHVETMYLLDLPVDKRAFPLPVKEIPWGRFEEVLKQKNLE